MVINEMDWAPYKDKDQLPVKDYFLVYLRDQPTWVEVHWHNEILICNYHDEIIEISLANVSHYCVPISPYESKGNN
ncbi:hypothetical protein GCM10017161_41800 [Thalassotalea marina]|uniref:Uncharacterized protein n=1 Tax=Thalassotalea marina TaxID=1673741 RepID=A0A919BRB8_9GAMM|nr:hypothetical protein GCM10017161_41800 [Thalassotalea marina]